MRCQKCGFENISGLSRCFRCDSILTVEKEKAIDVNPPRMPKWKRPLRGLGRIVRVCSPTVGSRAVATIESFAGMLGSDPIIGIILSFFPGLAHILQKRFKEIRYFVLAWFVLLLPAAFLWSTYFGAIIWGLALAIHGWIGIHAGVLREYISGRKRLFYLSAAMIFYGIAFYYAFCGHFLLRSVDVSGVTREVASQNIDSGDLLLGNRLFRAGGIERGDFVLTEVSNVVQHGEQYTVGRLNRMIYVQVVGLPDEKVEVKNGSFYVDGKELDRNRYTIPEWLNNQSITVRLNEKQYFVQYGTRGEGPRDVLKDFVHELFVRSSDAFHAKAFMVWSPVSKRSFLRD